MFLKWGMLKVKPTVFCFQNIQYIVNEEPKKLRRIHAHDGRLRLTHFYFLQKIVDS